MASAFAWSTFCLAFVACRSTTPPRLVSPPAQYILVGCDEKTIHHPETALTAIAPQPNADKLLVFDVSSPAQPRLFASLPLPNSVWGPPTNLALAPNAKFALVADSMVNEQKGPAWVASPNNQVHVVTLGTQRLERTSSVAVGRQPSGIDIHPQGHMALVANRADKNVTVLKLGADPARAQVLRHVDVAGQASDVKFTPDGKRALVTLFSEATVIVLRVEGNDVQLEHRIDVPSNPYPVVVAPSGRFALVSSMGAQAPSSDGEPDPVAIIDLQADPPVVVGKVLVGDAPEGLAIDPTGRFAATVNISGSSSPEASPVYHKNASVTLLGIAEGEQPTLSVLHTVDVGSLGEGIVFDRNGNYLYVGNFRDRSLSVLHIRANKLQTVGAPIPLGCQPGSVQ
jgi:DNA-binding beta-propeller fold protein YncE